ncbi:MAG: DUF2087 domain-containing protein [Rubrivivax sp.]|nr:DUF2087 domain-containing protein [Rubrivivax sp.]
MTRVPLPLVVPDLSAFARALGRAMKQRHATDPEPPGHSEVLGLVATALGHRNYQALRAALEDAGNPSAAAPGAARTTLSADAPAAAAAPAGALTDNARKTLGQFDAAGRLVRWPVKYTVQRLAMWVLWTQFEAKRRYTEREVNAILKAANAFGDHVTLRRELINHRLLARKSDCSEYWKLAPRADEETRALLRAWRERRSA